MKRCRRYSRTAWSSWLGGDLRLDGMQVDERLKQVLSRSLTALFHRPSLPTSRRLLDKLPFAPGTHRALLGGAISMHIFVRY